MNLKLRGAERGLDRQLLGAPRLLLLALVLVAGLSAVGAARLRGARVDLAALQAAHAELPPPPRVDMLVVPAEGADLDALAAELGELPGVAEARALRPPADPTLRQVTGARGAPVVHLSVDRLADDAALVAEVRRVAGVSPGQTPETRPLVVGLPVFNLAHAKAARDEQRLILPLVGLTLAALAALFTRRIAGVLLPLTAVGLAALATAGIVGASGSSLAGPNLLLLPLVIVLGLSESVFLLRDHAARLERGEPDAAAATLREVGWSCLLTSSTTVVGFLSLAVTGSAVLREFGLLAGAGTAIAWFTTVGVPAVVWSLFGEPSGFADPQREDSPLDAVVVRLLGWRPAGPLLAVLAVALAPLAASVQSHLPPGGELPDSAPERATWLAADEAVGGAALLQVELTTSQPDDDQVLDALITLGEALHPLPAVGSVIGPGQLVSAAMHGEPERIRRGPTFSRRMTWKRARAELAERDPAFPIDGPWRVQVQLHDQGAESWSQVLDRVEEVDARYDRIYLTPRGQVDVVVQAWRRLARDAALVVGSNLIVLIAGLGVAFRSGRIAVAGAVPLILTSEVCLAGMAALGVPLSPATLLIFSVAMGGGVDASIHLLSAAREAMDERGATPAEAVRAALAGAGVALGTSTALLLAGLAALLMSDLLVVRQVAMALLVAMSANAVLSVVGFAALGPWALRRDP